MSEHKLIDTLLPGVNLYEFNIFKDDRGEFQKLYSELNSEQTLTEFYPREILYSISHKNVIRGMHYQVGQYAQEKLVFCQRGKILDVVVCINPNLSHFNKPQSVILDEKVPQYLLISKDYAHGFLSLEHNSTVVYFTSTVHNKESDKGVLWSSIEFDWPVVNPIMSERDHNHPLISSLR